jgi:hypothetical protein
LFIVPTYELNRIGLKRSDVNLCQPSFGHIYEPATARAQCIQQLSSSPLKLQQLSLQAPGAPTSLLICAVSTSLRVDPLSAIVRFGELS